MLLINHLVLLVFSNSFIIQSNSSSLQHRLLMDLFEFQSGRRPPPNALPTDLIIKAFSCLPVKSLMRLRCMSKFYNSLISNPFFIDMHLRQSSRQNPQLAIVLKQPPFPSLRFIVPISQILPASMSIV
jgi:hypothetical protein